MGGEQKGPGRQVWGEKEVELQKEKRKLIPKGEGPPISHQ